MSALERRLLYSLPNNEVRDNFVAEYSVISKVWEALSPDTVLAPFVKDYKCLSQVHQSVQPSIDSPKTPDRKPTPEAGKKTEKQEACPSEWMCGRQRVSAINRKVLCGDAG